MSSLDLLAINTVRVLSMDAVQAAESGHPGTPMALAPLVYRLYTHHLRHDPQSPDWADRDRFVLSVGHASMVLYSALHLSGYDLSLDEIKRFRQWGSKTPGHPEFGHTAGVETTTGPLGQGVANAVGMAISEAHLAATFNRPGHAVVDHFTWFIAGDGCLMEGISHEAASLAGHLKLGKLIGFFDDNGITIDGATSLACSDDAALRFASYGWHVTRIADVNDLDAVDRAIAEAKSVSDRPSLVITRTQIGYGSPNRVNTAKAHGEPLGAAEIALTKPNLGWTWPEPFHVPAEAAQRWREGAATCARAHDAWRRRFDAYRAAHGDLADEFERRMRGTLPSGWAHALPTFTAETGAVATRAASGTVLNSLAPAVPELVGGSADLTGSNNTNWKGVGILSAANPAGRYVHWGIREHAMGAAMNGMALHGGVVPFGGTFLVFADYCRPAIRLAALMGVKVIYVFTHDSIGLGEDGPTHQPVEHLATLRAIPNCLVLRPGDANEVAEAWRVAVAHAGGPVCLVLTRQKVAFIDRAAHAPAAGVAHGAYVLKDVAAPRVVLIATGSEVELALKAAAQLQADGVPARVVSMPSMERFAAQSAEYRAAVLPPGVPRVAVEAAHPQSWYRWVGDTGAIVGIERFGASAPFGTLYREFGITVERVVEETRRVVG
ncbi:MAG: transketolase [Gemmatimonadota bacterium]